MLRKQDQNFIPFIEAPENTFELIIQIYYFQTSNLDKHGHMDATIRQKNHN